MRYLSQPGPPKEWATVIPHAGNLSVDFLSFLRPPAAAAALSQKDLVQLARECGIPLDEGNRPKLPAGALRLDGSSHIHVCATVRRSCTSHFFAGSCVDFTEAPGQHSNGPKQLHVACSPRFDECSAAHLAGGGVRVALPHLHTLDHVPTD